MSIVFEKATRGFALLNPYQRSLISALAGFLFYGTWAFMVNLSHSSTAAIKAACVQGSYSFVLTLTMTMLIEALFRTFRHLFNNTLLIIWTTILLACGLIFSASWLVNVLAQTPNILETVILGYVIGGSYTVIYVSSLAQHIEQ